MYFFQIEYFFINFTQKVVFSNKINFFIVKKINVYKKLL